MQIEKRCEKTQLVLVQNLFLQYFKNILPVGYLRLFDCSKINYTI